MKALWLAVVLAGCAHGIEVRDAAWAELDAAWSTPANTRVEPPSLDVNSMLESRGVALDQSQLWAIEVAKAHDARTYLPGMASTSETYGHERFDRVERFFRRSTQRAWRTGAWVPVLEEVVIDHRARRIAFRGREAGAPAGTPLFDVEHAVGGSPSRPRIEWRLVLHTTEEDPALRAQVASVVEQPGLPPYLEVGLAKRPWVTN